MQRFYTDLIRGNMGKGEALNSAEMSLLRGKAYCYPYYWVPFILLGDWRR
jgi:CHAT domain-containing protein